MKKLIVTTFFSISAVISNAQQRIQSIQLDSAIYNQINNVRLQNNKPALKKFLFNEIRDFSYTVTNANCSNVYFQHSSMDSCRKYCTEECIYRYRLTCGNASNYDTQQHPENIEKIAANVVTAWMNSPSHHDAILRTENQKITVTSIIEISDDRKSAIISVSYHTVQTTTKIEEIPYGLQSNSSYYMK